MFIKQYNEKFVIAIFSILKEVFYEKKHADKCLQQYFAKHSKLTLADKAFVAELCYDLIRNWRLLQESYGQTNEVIFKNPFAFLPSYYYFRNIELPKQLQQINFSKKLFQQKLAANLKIRKFKASYPDDLDSYCANDLGEEKWNALSEALNEPAPQYIRANTIKISRDNLSKLLSENRIKNRIVEDSVNGIENISIHQLFTTKEFHNGLFEIQDIASQKVSEFMEIKQGDRVIDACAGNGGKTLHIGSLLNNKGKVIAMDISDYKLELLKKRAVRAGLQNIETKLIDNDKVVKRLQHTADKLLLDVPCSGTGVFKRNPDAKWNMDSQHILQLIETQKELLDKYSEMCKIGGKMVYANCSILPSEGEKQIASFLNTHPQWKLEEELRIHPDLAKADGFYMARLQRMQ